MFRKLAYLALFTGAVALVALRAAFPAAWKRAEEKKLRGWLG
jgi:hypothetical protein